MRHQPEDKWWSAHSADTSQQTACGKGQTIPCPVYCFRWLFLAEKLESDGETQDTADDEFYIADFQGGDFLEDEHAENSGN